MENYHWLSFGEGHIDSATADSRQRGPNILAAAAAYGAPIEFFGGGTKKIRRPAT